MGRHTETVVTFVGVRLGSVWFVQKRCQCPDVNWVVGVERGWVNQVREVSGYGVIDREMLSLGGHDINR